MDNYIFLDTDKKTAGYFSSLKQRGIEKTAVDLEGEFNLHHYGEHLCLIQIYDGEQCVIIDPLKVSVSLIKNFFEDSSVLKIMYGCSTDRTLLYRKYGISLNSVMDLYLASEILDYQKKGLDSMLEYHFILNKKNKKKYQKYNWMKRPVQKGALEYASEDVAYLFKLSTVLMKEMFERNLIETYILKNNELQIRPITEDPVPGILKKRRYRNLSKKSKKIFLSLFDMRDKYAEKLDLPPNSVFSNDDLFSLASFALIPEKTPVSSKMNSKMREDIYDDIRRCIG